MRVLVIDNQLKAQVESVKNYAQLNQRNLDKFDQLMNGQIDPAGEDPNHCIVTETGIKIVFSIEEFPSFGKVQRFSVSVAGNADAYPSIPLVDEIIHLFGICDGLHQIDVVNIDHSCNAIVATHLVDRHYAEIKETSGQLPSKDDREDLIKKAGQFYESLHESR